MQRVWSTDDVTAADRQAYWREAVCRTFVKLDVHTTVNGDRFRGRVGSTDLGPIRVCFIDANPMDALRTDRNIAQLHEDDLLVGLHVTGTAHGEQDGRTTTLGPGDFALFDATRPYRVDFLGGDRFFHVVLQFPRVLLEARTGTTHDLTARAPDTTAGTGPLTSRFLLELARQSSHIPEAKAAHLADEAIDLLALALTPTAEAARPDQILWRRVQDHIDWHLDDGDLTPESVAAAHHISVRTLYNLFRSHADMPVSAWIQQQRFRNIRRDLQDPRCDHLTVAEIGRRRGVPNAAYLSRTYRDHFRMTPTEERLDRSTLQDT